MGHHTPSRILKNVVTLIITTGIGISLQSAIGATSTWTGGAGGSNTNWQKNTNWSGSTTPSSGNDLVFAGTVSLSNTNNISSFTANSITFNASAGAFTLNGQPLTTGSGGITNNSTNTETLSFNGTGITLGAAQTWNAASGAINVNTRVQLNGNSLTLVGPNNIDFTSKISGTSSGPISISVGDISGKAGNVTLDANNDFGPGFLGIGVELFSGTLTVNNANGLGTGALAIKNSGTSAGVTLASTNAGIKIANSVNVITDFSVSPTNVLQLTGNITLSAGSQPTFKITLTNSGTLVSSGGISETGGSAGLTLDAAGNGGQFTFSGSTANTYSGLTTVTGSATLVLNNSTTNGAIPGNLQIDAGSTVKLNQDEQIADTSVVTVDGTLQLNGHSETILELDGSSTGFVRLQNGGLTVQQGTFAGAINTSSNPPGGDTLTKTGTGTLELSGNSKYAGGTFLNGGALIADNNNALGTGTLTINNLGSGVLIGSGTDGINLGNNIDVKTNFFVAPAMSGTGRLTVSGLITLDTSSGSTVYTITATNGNTFRMIGGIAESGTGSASLVYDGGGSGVNGVFRIGAPSAASTYTGFTLVTDDATLQLNSSIPNVSVPGMLQIDKGSTVSIINNEQIADSAAVMVNGLLDLNGNTETINDLEGSGRVRLDSGTFVVSQGSFSGQINDGANPGGSLIKNGAGALILSGVNGYTGTTTVNAGLLQVDGSLASANTIVNNGATLSGIGSVAGNVTNSGIVTPGGNSIGTFTIGGNYTQNAAGALLIQIAGTAAGQHDLLAVTGSASLDGKLQLVRLGNFTLHPADKIVILSTGGGVSGQFSSVDTGTILNAQVTYGTDDVIVQFLQGSFSALPNLTPNQHSVSVNINAVLNDPREAALINFLNNEPLGNLPHDYDLIAPEELASIFDIAFSYADVQVSNIETRLAQIRNQGATTEVTVANLSYQDGKTIAGLTKEDDKKSVNAPAPESKSKWDVYMEGSGDFVRVNGDLNAPGYDFTTGGVTIGADYHVCDHFTAGIMGGYANTGATLTQNGSVDVNSGRVGLYSTAYGNGFYLNTLAAGGYNSYDTHRIGLGGLATGNTDGGEFDGYIGTGYELHQGNVTLGPIASAQYTYVGISGFNEAGSLAPLHIDSQSQESLRTKVGFKIGSDWKVRSVTVSPSLTAAWQHEFMDATAALDSSFASGAGNVFTVQGPALGRDAVVVNAGVNVQWTPRLGSYLYYYGELGRKNYQLNSVSGGLSVSF